MYPVVVLGAARDWPDLHQEQSTRAEKNGSRSDKNISFQQPAACL